VVPSKGLLAAAFTPMKPDAAVDFDRVGPLVDHFVNDGVAGIFALGSTGEGASLTANEKREVLKAFVEAKNPPGLAETLVRVASEKRDPQAVQDSYPHIDWNENARRVLVVGLCPVSRQRPACRSRLRYRWPGRHARSFKGTLVAKR